MRNLSSTPYILLFVFLIIPFYSSGQFVDYGTDPASLRWRIGKTQHYKLIFPEGTDSVAYVYAQLLENAYPYEQATMNYSIKRKFPVILHPGNMLSNGMVAFAPRRMELLTTPPTSLNAQKWDRQLILHESRHVLQTAKLMGGVFKPFYYLFGEQVSGVSSFAVPSWFFEGDAVVTETAMSNSGRGRLPEFHMPFRAQMMEKNFFSLDKWYMGSYKDYTSTYYALGYHMTAYARQQYGGGIWNKVVHRFPRRFFSIPPFSNALKHYTGMNTKRLFADTYAYLENEWSRQDSAYALSGFSDKQTIVSPENKLYTSYQYPIVVGDSIVFALKSGIEEINSLVEIRNGKEKRIVYTGTVNSKLIHSQDKLYWMEYEPGLRWTHQNYSVLKCLDLATRQVSTLTCADRLLTPAITPSGTEIAFSKPEEDGRNHILLMKRDGFEEVARFDIPGNAFVKDLVFVDEAELAALVIGDKGIRLMLLDCRTAEWCELLGPLSVNLSSLYYKDDRLYFESGVDGTNNIYRMDLTTGKAEQLTISRFGAFTPSVTSDGERLYFADYQAKGHRISFVSIAQLNAKPTDFNTPYTYELAETIASQESFNMDDATFAEVPFETKPYRKALNLLRVHSWAPFYYDAMDVAAMQGDDFSTLLRPGAMVLSQNALNTMILQAGWYYADREHHGKMAFSYKGLFPVFNFSLDYGGKAFDLNWKKDEEGKSYDSISIAGRHRVEAEAQVYLPLNLSKGHLVRGFQPALTYYYTNDKYQQWKSGRMAGFQYLLSELRYYSYQKMALRDIYPRLGYQVRLQHLFSPGNSENFGSLYAARLTTYLPGLKKNDGLMLRLGYQFQSVDGKVFFFSKRLLDNPRGYEYMYQSRQMLSAKADYAFTIYCPDVSIGNLAYIKRFRSNLFYDLTANQRDKSQARWDTYTSFGIDLLFDCNFFRLNFPVTIGLRLIQPVEYGSFQTESVFSMSF